MKTAVGIIIMTGRLVGFGNLGCGWQVGLPSNDPPGGFPGIVARWLTFRSRRVARWLISVLSIFAAGFLLALFSFSTGITE